MPYMNTVNLIGNLTRDPELRYTKDGSAVCDIGLAVNRKYTDSSGAKKEEVLFVDVTAWLKNAERLKEWTQKGTCVLIMGRLQYDSWVSKEDNKKRSKIRIVAEQFQILSRGKFKDADEDTAGAPPAQPEGALPPVTEDDIPF